jgi:hypothetical protein
MPAALSGQAMVEYGLGLAASGTAGAPGQTAGRSIAGIMSNLTQTLNSANQAPAAAAAAVAAVPAKPAAVAAVPGKPPKPSVTYEDSSGITAGMDRTEMIKRFGPSAMQILSSGGRESFTYEFKDRTVDVEVLNGKVASVKMTKSKAKQSALVVIP